MFGEVQSTMKEFSIVAIGAVVLSLLVFTLFYLAGIPLNPDGKDMTVVTGASLILVWACRRILKKRGTVRR